MAGRLHHADDWNGNDGRPPKNLPQTFDQMVASNEASKPKKSDRRSMIEANKFEIATLVGDLADRLETSERDKKDGIKINLRDSDRVKEITLKYIRSCQFTGTLPTLTGCALACGYTGNSFAYFIKNNPEHETTKWLSELKRQFGELLNQAALAGDVAPIPAIFTLKASYNWNDQPVQETVDNSEAEDLSPDAIAAKYEDLPE